MSVCLRGLIIRKCSTRLLVCNYKALRRVLLKTNFVRLCPWNGSHVVFVCLRMAGADAALRCCQQEMALVKMLTLRLAFFSTDGEGVSESTACHRKLNTHAERAHKLMEAIFLFNTQTNKKKTWNLSVPLSFWTEKKNKKKTALLDVSLLLTHRGFKSNRDVCPCFQMSLKCDHIVF